MSNVVDDSELELQDDEVLTNIDTSNDDSDIDDIESDSIEEEVVKEPDYSLPDRFKDKSIEDVAKSYIDLEKAFGRRNQELGDLRKMTDDLMKLELDAKRENQYTEQPRNEAESIDIDTLLDNPDMVINKAINSNPRLKALEEQLQTQSRSRNKKGFESNHPDFETVISSDKFKDWIGSSKYRTEQFKIAHTDYDYDLADELFSTFKQINGTQDATNKDAKAERSKQVKSATLESGSTGVKKTKIYRREDIRNLKRFNPQKYEAMEDDIYKAYQEGRVK